MCGKTNDVMHTLIIFFLLTGKFFTSNSKGSTVTTSPSVPDTSKLWKLGLLIDPVLGVLVRLRANVTVAPPASTENYTTMCETSSRRQDSSTRYSISRWSTIPPPSTSYFKLWSNYGSRPSKSSSRQIMSGDFNLSSIRPAMNAIRGLPALILSRLYYFFSSPLIFDCPFDQRRVPRPIAKILVFLLPRTSATFSSPKFNSCWLCPSIDPKRQWYNHIYFNEETCMIAGQTLKAFSLHSTSRSLLSSHLKTLIRGAVVWRIGHCTITLNRRDVYDR